MKKLYLAVAFTFIFSIVMAAPPGRPLIPGTSQCQMYQDRNGNMVFVDAATGPVTLVTLATGSGGGQVSLSTGVTGVLPVANGGSGTSTPGLIAGTNITSITGSWPNQTINAATQGGGSGVTVYPASATASFPFGETASTLTVTGTGPISIGTQSSTTTVYGNLSSFGGFYLSSATSNGAAGIINANYTTGCTDSVIFASGTAAGITVTLEGASVCASTNTMNHVLQITKVDTSTYPITIVTKSGNTVMGTTGTLTLNSIGQTDEIISDGQNNWWPHGGGLQITPQAIFYSQYSQVSTFIVPTSSAIVTCPFTTTIPLTVLGYSYDETGVAAANISFGIMDINGNVLTSTGPITGIQFGSVLKTNAFNLPPGSYQLAFQVSNTVATFAGDVNPFDGLFGCNYTSESALGIVSVPIPGTFWSRGPGIAIIVAGGRQTYN